MYLEVVNNRPEQRLSTEDILISHYVFRLRQYASLPERNAATVGILQAIAQDLDVNYTLQHTRALARASAIAASLPVIEDQDRKPYWSNVKRAEYPEVGQ